MQFRTRDLEDFYFDGMAAWEEFYDCLATRGIDDRWGVSPDINVPLLLVGYAIELDRGRKTLPLDRLQSDSFRRLLQKAHLLYRIETNAVTQLLPCASAFIIGWDVARTISNPDNAAEADFCIIGDGEENVIFPSPTVLQSVFDFSDAEEKTCVAIADLLMAGTERPAGRPFWSENKDRFMWGDDVFLWDAERGWITTKKLISHRPSATPPPVQS